jgi:uncharacterized membrane protein YgdD (TMEM256/DUF423 family)
VSVADRNIVVAAALSAALSIAAGAFGAHGAEPQAAEWLRTGGFYQLTHATAALWLAARHPRIAVVLLTGSTWFALTLYGLALGGPRWLGALAPLGGSAMIAGWLALAWTQLRRH